MTKTNTRVKNATPKTAKATNTQAKSGAGVDPAVLAKMVADAVALAFAQFAPALGEIKPAPVADPAPKAKSAKAKAKAANARAWETRKASIAEAKETGATRTYAQALTLATAQIVHNRAQALTANPKAEFLNGAIAKSSPSSVRVWLTSTEHQAYKASRDAHGVSPADSDANLLASVAKAVKAKTRK